MKNPIKIPLTYPLFGSAELKLLQECLESKWVTQGAMCKKFEHLIAVRQKVRYARATNSCTAALHLAMLALGIQRNDEVIVPAFTWVSSANCVEFVGARPVFVDINLDTYNIDPEAIEAAITNRTKAIVAVHLFGLPAEMERIAAIAKRHNLKVVEDAACAMGSIYKGKCVGGLGDIGAFSFHPRKVISTGEGGALTTNSKKIAQLVTSYRSHGSSISRKNKLQFRPYSMDFFNLAGYNYRFPDILAAVGIAQMARLDGLLAERRMLAQRYSEKFFNVEEFVRPIEPKGCVHTYQSYVIRLRKGSKKERNMLMNYLALHGIQTRPPTHAVHRLGYYRHKYDITACCFPNACRAEDLGVTLPLYPGMRQTTQDFVVSILKKGLLHMK